MNCAVHSEVEATGFCRNCGKALCAQCRRDVRGILYCETCLADLLSKPQPPAGAGSPGLAAVLGFIPGLGAVYNGEYVKALIHLLIFAGLVAAADTGGGGETFFTLVAIAFYCYMPIEAYHTAKARMLGQARPAPMGDLATFRPVGPFILIGLGVLFLLNQYLPIWHLIGRGWPVVFIAIGVLLLWKQMQRSN